MDDIQNEGITWIIAPMHIFIKKLLIVGSFIGIIGITTLGIIQWRIYTLDINIVGFLLAIFISLPLGFALIFRKCPIRLGVSETKIVIDWYVKPEEYRLDNSKIPDYFPGAIKGIKAPNEIRFENVIDFQIYNYSGGSWQSGGFYYMSDKSVMNTSGIGLDLNNVILSALYHWLKIHAPESQLFLKLENAREK